MAEKEVKEVEEAKKPEEDSLMDYASKRLVELKNSEQMFMNAVAKARNDLETQQANLIACRGRIDEMTRIIQGQTPPPKKP